MSHECEGCGGDIGRIYEQQGGRVYPFKCAECEVKELRRIAATPSVELGEVVAWLQKIEARLEIVERRLELPE